MTSGWKWVRQLYIGTHPLLVRSKVETQLAASPMCRREILETKPHHELNLPRQAFASGAQYWATLTNSWQLWAMRFRGDLSACQRSDEPEAVLGYSRAATGSLAQLRGILGCGWNSQSFLSSSELCVVIK